MHSVIRHLSWIVLGLAACPWLCAQGSTNCVCGGFNSARAEGGSAFVDGADFARARTLLTNPAFFGAGGVVSKPVVISGGVQSFQGAGSTHVFFTGRTATSSYSLSEKNALLNAVLGGMNLVVTSDDTSHDISSLFGVTLENAGAEMSTAHVPDHIFFAGPFGRITQFRNAGVNQGRFIGWPKTALPLASGSAGASMVYIPRAALGVSSGAVVFLAGVDNLTTVGRVLNQSSSDPDIPVTDALLMNLVAGLCNPSLPAQAPHLIFPQFANGDNNVSHLVLTNAEPDAMVNATVRLRDDNGAPMSINILGLGSANSFQTGNLEPYQTPVYMTDGTGALKSGWASVRGTGAISGTVLFYAPGLGATGVGASEAAGGFVLPVVAQPVMNPSTGRVEAKEIYTGLAVCNLSAVPALVRLELWDHGTGRRSDGTLLISIPAFGHTSGFLFQLYQSLDLRGFRGSLRIVSTNTLIAATALQLGSGAGQFTALPVKPLYR